MIKGSQIYRTSSISLPLTSLTLKPPRPQKKKISFLEARGKKVSGEKRKPHKIEKQSQIAITISTIYFLPYSKAQLGSNTVLVKLTSRLGKARQKAVSTHQLTKTLPVKV